MIGLVELETSVTANLWGIEWQIRALSSLNLFLARCKRVLDTCQVPSKYHTSSSHFGMITSSKAFGVENIYAVPWTGKVCQKVGNNILSVRTADFSEKPQTIKIRVSYIEKPSKKYFAWIHLHKSLFSSRLVINSPSLSRHLAPTQSRALEVQCHTSRPHMKA